MLYIAALCATICAMENSTDLPDAKPNDTPFTPGPWQTVQNMIGHIHPWCPLAVVFGHTKNDGNARLIAAAPELLHALETILEYEDVSEELRVGAEAVINKVYGCPVEQIPPA
jgi:hypothetical protein